MNFVNPFQEKDESREDELCSSSTTQTEDEGLALLQRETAHREWCNPRAGRTWSFSYPGGPTRTRFAAILMVGVLVCVTACIVLFHPHKSSLFVVPVRRCMYWNSAT
jgi:hypothetical protein